MFCKKKYSKKKLVKLVKIKRRGSAISKNLSLGVRDLQKVKNRCRKKL
jgi:hypothetical protein